VNTQTDKIIHLAPSLLWKQEQGTPANRAHWSRFAGKTSCFRFCSDFFTACL